MSRTGGDAGGGGGGRKLGNHPQPPPPTPRPDGGDKEGTTEPATAGGGGVIQRATWWDPGRGGPREPSPAPAPRHTPPCSRSVPYRSNFLSRGRKHRVPPDRKQPKPRSALSRDPGGESARSCPAPSPRTHSPHPPRPAGSRRRSARFWRPESRRGDRGPKGTPRAAGAGVSEPTLVASSLLRSIRARVRDSIRDIIRWRGAQEQAASYRGGRAGRGLPRARQPGGQEV